MCAEGFEETELMYAVDNENEKNWHTDYAKGINLKQDTV